MVGFDGVKFATGSQERQCVLSTSVINQSVVSWDKTHRIEGIHDINDHSDKEGMRVLRAVGFRKRQPFDLNLICWLPEPN